MTAKKKRSAKKKAAPKKAKATRKASTRKPRGLPFDSAVFNSIVAGTLAGLVQRFVGGGNTPSTELRWTIETYDRDGNQIEKVSRPIAESVDHALRERERDGGVWKAVVTGRDGAYSCESYVRRDGLLCMGRDFGDVVE